jgi:hypothetical protein
VDGSLGNDSGVVGLGNVDATTLPRRVGNWGHLNPVSSEGLINRELRARRTSAAREAQAAPGAGPWPCLDGLRRLRGIIERCDKRGVETMLDAKGVDGLVDAKRNSVDAAFDATEPARRGGSQIAPALGGLFPFSRRRTSRK